MSVNVLAYLSEHAKFISRNLWGKIYQQISDEHSEKLQSAQIFRSFTENRCLTCHDMAKVDVYLSIRHASKTNLAYYSMVDNRRTNSHTNNRKKSPGILGLQ